MDVAGFLKRAAERAGYHRDHFVERNLPTQPSNARAVVFYGDLRAACLLSAFVLRPYKELHRDKYLVLCTWPGMRSLFPYADEYWSVADESAARKLAAGVNNFYNVAPLAADLTRGVAEVLDVVTAKDLSAWYDRGFTRAYREAFGGPRRFLPEVPSATVAAALREQLSRREGTPVVVYPATRLRSWQQGRTVPVAVGRDCWVALAETLIGAGYVPVVYQNWFTHDVSPVMADRCVYLTAPDFAATLAAFREVGRVLDVHAGVSKLAALARTPFVAVTERQSLVADRDYEADELLGGNLPRGYAFSFSTQLLAGGPDEWKASVFDNALARLQGLGVAPLPPTAESYGPVSEEGVRRHAARRLGAAFIGSSKRI